MRHLCALASQFFPPVSHLSCTTRIHIPIHYTTFAARVTMWINVRSIDGTKNVKLDGLSKLCSIKELRRKLVKPFQVTLDRQQLYYRGKQLVDGHTLHDYHVKLNDVIQIRIRPADEPNKADSNSGYESSTSTVDLMDVDNESVKKNSIEEEEEVECSRYYKVGDFIDAKEQDTGSWYEAKIIKIVKENKFDEGFHSSEDENENTIVVQEQRSKIGSIGETVGFDMDKEYTFYITYDGYEGDMPVKVKFPNIRPRSYKIVKPKEVKVGDVLLVNYNIEEPLERGYWFDVCMTKVETSKSQFKNVVATLLVGSANTPVENCSIRFVDDMFRIEKPEKLYERSVQMDVLMQSQPPPKRKSKPDCAKCNDNPKKKCKECACACCGKKDNPDKQILCDECNVAYHIWCLDVPIETVPEDDWYCPNCKIDRSEVVNAGEKLKASKKKGMMPSSSSTCSRDWGKGMACVGKTTTCTIVAQNHFGSVPNVYVGSLWKFRIQVSEAGIHRPPVGGIHGRSAEGAYSIVLSGGYEDDVDNGEEFTYTGSGGRNLSGNKRTSDQSFDQSLKRTNLALAVSCNANVDNKNGAEAKNWRAGKPVRVVRNFKGAKHSIYCPKEGNRYDGLYKVVKYWAEHGKSGYLVWRFLLRRDDPEPAPWTKQGRKLAESRGLVMQYPKGYIKGVTYIEEEAAEEEEDEEEEKESKAKKRKKGAKENMSNVKRRKKLDLLRVPEALLQLIKKDKLNEKLWQECLQCVSKGHTEFLKKVEEVFVCICCQDIVCIPVTTDCLHNFCNECLKRSFKAQVYSCSACRNDLKPIRSSPPLNANLRKVLQELFKGYEDGR